MTSITSDPRPQAGTSDPRTALAMALDRFTCLTATGIWGRRTINGAPIDADDVALALTFLHRCARTKRPTVFTDDLVRAVSRSAGQRVSLGAVIAAARS